MSSSVLFAKVQFVSFAAWGLCGFVGNRSWHKYSLADLEPCRVQQRICPSKIFNRQFNAMPMEGCLHYIPKRVSLIESVPIAGIRMFLRLICLRDLGAIR